jgi:hypothetical protein
MPWSCQAWVEDRPDDAIRAGQAMDERSKSRIVEKSPSSAHTTNPAESAHAAAVEAGPTGWHLHGGASVARIPDTVSNGNNLHHLRQTYIHLFTVPLCRTSEHVPGTILAGSRAFRSST